MSLNPGLATAAGIGQGLMSFADSYMKSKQMANQNAMNQQYVQLAKQKEQAGLLGQGMTTDDQGNVQYNPVQQGLIAQQKATQQAQSDISSHELDPESDESKLAYQNYKTRAESAHPGSGQFIPQGKSALWYKQEIEPHLEKEETLANTLAAAKLKAESMQPLAQARMAGVANQQDRIAAQAGDLFDKNSILTKINKQKQQIDLDKHTLENSTSLTPQMLNEVQQGIANAISGGGSAGLGKTEQIEIQTAQQKIAELKQKFTSDPTPVNDPKLIQYFHDTLERLGDAYDINAYSRAQQIFQGRSKAYKNNPAALEVMKDKLDSYKPKSQGLLGGEGQGQQQGPPGGHQTVQQNGHTYNWNPSTQKYE
jgi:hypothetical protein